MVLLSGIGMQDGSMWPQNEGQTVQMSPASSNVTISNPQKGPKVPMTIAAVLVVIGLVGFLVAAVVGASIEDTFNNLSTKEYTQAVGDNITLGYDDPDSLGEEGWYLLIEGDPNTDADGNGQADACDGLNFTIVLENSTASNESGNDIDIGVARFDCDIRGDNSEEAYFDIENHIIIARVCYTIGDEDGVTEHDCKTGDRIHFSNDGGANMSIVDLDKMYEPFVEDLIVDGVVTAISFAAGCCSICGGVVALFVGLMRVGGKKTPEQNIRFEVQ